jgi:hypothetical protein
MFTQPQQQHSGTHYHPYSLVTKHATEQKQKSRAAQYARRQKLKAEESAK